MRECFHCTGIEKFRIQKHGNKEINISYRYCLKTNKKSKTNHNNLKRNSSLKCIHIFCIKYTYAVNSDPERRSTRLFC